MRAVGVRLGGSGFVDTVIAISMTYFVSAYHWDRTYANIHEVYSLPVVNQRQSGT